MGKDFQQKDMEGALFKNDEKTPENKQPDYSGSMTIKGQKYNIGAWINIGKQSGKKFMALKIQEWGNREKAVANQTRSEPEFKDDDLSDVPF